MSTGTAIQAINTITAERETMTASMSLERWVAIRGTVATDPEREERLRRKAERRGVIPRTERNPTATGSQEQPQEWDISKPCRGLGDMVAKITHAVGIDTLVKAVKPKGCGCAKRQERLNAAVPFSGNQ